MSITPVQRRHRGLLLILLLAAFALRLYQIELQSLWDDEGISLLRSSQPLPQLLAAMPIEQLPGYFVLLHGWLRVAGETDFALRFFSVLPSVLAVALLYRLGADLGDWRAGLIALLLLLANPLQIWYAQEGRTYSWLMFGALWATWCFWRLVQGGRTASWLGYVVATTLTVYLHFYGFLVPIAHAIYFVAWFARYRDWRVAGRWVGAGVAVFLLFLPWLPRAWAIFGFQGWREPVDPWQLPWRFLMAYTTGGSLPPAWADGMTWLYLALALAGVAAWWRVHPTAAIFVAAQAFIPWAIVFGLVLRQPDTHERYTIFITAPLLLLAAGAIAWPARSAGMARRLGALLAGFVLAGLALVGLVAIQRQHHDPALQKPDMRTAAYAIFDWEQPGDIIVVDGPDPRLVFLHYYKGSLPVHHLRDLEGAGYERTDAVLSDVTAGAARVWEVMLYRIPGPPQFWLATRGWSIPPTEYNGVRVTLYGLALSANPRWQPLDLPVGPALTLTRALVDPAETRGGELVRVSTEWQVGEPPPEYRFSLRLSHADGQPIQFQDYAPQNWFTPTSGWPVGAMMTDQRGFLLPRDLPPGRYLITLRLYDPSNGEAVETAAGIDLLLGEFTVTPQ